MEFDSHSACQKCAASVTLRSHPVQVPYSSSSLAHILSLVPEKRSKHKTQLLADCRLNYPRLNFPRDCACAQVHDEVLGQGSPQAVDRPDRMKVVTSADMFTANAFTHSHKAQKRNERQVKRNQKTIEKAATIVIIIINIGRSLIWPDKNTYTYMYIHPVYCILDPCIVSLGRRHSHSHFGQVFDSLFLSQIKWHAYYFYGYTVANRIHCSTVTYPAHILLKSLRYMTRSSERSNLLKKHISQIKLVFPLFCLTNIAGYCKVHDTHKSIIYNNRVLFG